MTLRLRLAGRVAAHCVLGVALCMLGPAVALAEDVPPASAGSSDETDWIQRLEDARRALRAAEQRVTAAEAAYQDWRQRKYPRGAKKAEMLAEVDAAHVALGDARDHYPTVLQAARRAGVSPGALRPFETP